MQVYERAIPAVPKEQRLSVVELYVSRATDFFGIAKVSMRGSQFSVLKPKPCFYKLAGCLFCCCGCAVSGTPGGHISSALLCTGKSYQFPVIMAVHCHQPSCMSVWCSILTCDVGSATQVREIYETAIESEPPADLPAADVRVVCVRYAQLERKLGEIDRARAIFVHGSHLADPRTAK